MYRHCTEATLAARLQPCGIGICKANVIPLHPGGGGGGGAPVRRPRDGPQAGGRRHRHHPHRRLGRVRHDGTCKQGAPVGPVVRSALRPVRQQCPSSTVSITSEVGRHVDFSRTSCAAF